MEAFELILLLSAAVLLSAVLEQVVPKVSLPLIQIALGVLIALLISDVEITFSPEFFLLVFIAPLLFNDAKNADKLGLWKNRHNILSLAVGLVLAIVLVVGFTLHLLIPSIPLAAAFAMGAALGPTDAVAVSSLKETTKLSRKENALLSGESLLNDASGVVSFQFAIAAAVTGSFSLLDASATFALSFFGGILFGLVIGWIAHLIQVNIGKLGVDSTTFHVMFDITLPFIIYLLSELLGVSGILAVVAAGILMSAYTDRVIGPASSRLSIVSSSAWSVLAFALNGIVFVMLGIELPISLRSTWGDGIGQDFALIVLVLVITVIIVGVRFFWILMLETFAKDPETGGPYAPKAERIRSALVSTIGGPKGAVTLSVIFSIPYLTDTGLAFPERDLILFLTSGVILCTLLLANFLLPVLAPRHVATTDEFEQVAQAKIDIMRHVIERLSALRSEECARTVDVVIKSYNKRIERIRTSADIESESTTKLRIEAAKVQYDYVLGAIESAQIDECDGYDYLKRLVQARNHLMHVKSRFWISQGRFRHHKITFVRIAMRSLLHLGSRLRGEGPSSTLIDIQRASETHAIDYLQELLNSESSEYPAEVIAEVLLSYQSSLRALDSSRPGITQYAHTIDSTSDIERAAYNIELDEIGEAYENDLIDRSTAKSMRDNVYLMLVDLDAHI